MFGINSQLKITRLLLAESGTYNDMYQRPYRSHMDAQTIDHFMEFTTAGHDISPAVCAGLAGDVLRPQAAPMGPGGMPQIVQIQNGWGERRMRFLLEFEIHEGALGTTRWVYSGMTDHVGYTRGSGSNVHIDPMMRFTINTSAFFATTTVNTPTGTTQMWSIRDPSHVINQLPGESPGSDPFALKTLITPYNVVGKMMTASVGNDEMEEFDTRGNMLSGVKKSFRRNVMPSQFISKLMSEIVSSNTDTETQDASQLDQISAVRTNLEDPRAYSDPFLCQLKNNSQYESTNYFTYQELLNIAPGADFVAKIAPPAPADVRVHRRGQTDDWVATSQTAVIATLLVQGVPAIMMEHILTIIKFTATNRTTDRSFVIIPDERSFRSFNNSLTKDGMWRYVQAFMQRLKSELLRDISHNNLFDVNITMQCEIMGDTFLTIQINNDPEVEYAIPSFCDSLIAPIIDNGDMALSVISQDFTNLSANMQMQMAYNSGGSMMGNDPHTTRSLPPPQSGLILPHGNFGGLNNDTPEFLI